MLEAMGECIVTATDEISDCSEDKISLLTEETGLVQITKMRLKAAAPIEPLLAFLPSFDKYTLNS